MPLTKPKGLEKPVPALQQYAHYQEYQRLPEIINTVAHPTQLYGNQIPPSPPKANAENGTVVNHPIPRVAEVLLRKKEDPPRFSPIRRRHLPMSTEGSG